MLEVLVVLAIVGVVATVAVPQLSTLAARVEFALNRENFERSLSLLPYQAYKRNQDFILGSVKRSDPSNEDEQGLVSFRMTSIDADANTAVTVEAPILMTPAPLALPQGWRLEVPVPIVFRSTGLCSGGAIAVFVENISYRYELSAPQCIPVTK